MLSKSEVKYIQSLGQKKSRDEAGLFIAEGPKLVAELLAHPSCRFQRIYALSSWIEQNPDLKVPVTEITEAELEKISQLMTPNKVLAVLFQFEAAETIPGDNWTLVLDGIRDPGNLGTIIRLADWFGISQIICSEDSADCYNIKVVQATMGSIARVKIGYKDIAAFIQQTRLPVLGTTLSGKDVRSYEFPSAGLLVIGNESTGVRPDVLKQVTAEIMIPRFGEAESLNAAVATGLLLWELRR